MLWMYKSFMHLWVIIIFIMLQLCHKCIQNVNDHYNFRKWNFHAVYSARNMKKFNDFLFLCWWILDIPYLQFGQAVCTYQQILQSSCWHTALHVQYCSLISIHFLHNTLGIFLKSFFKMTIMLTFTYYVIGYIYFGKYIHDGICKLFVPFILTC